MTAVMSDAIAFSRYGHPDVLAPSKLEVPRPARDRSGSASAR